MIDFNILNINLTDFKNKFYYGVNISIPNKVLDLNANITEEQFFNKLSLDVITTCDLFINQKLSKVLKEIKEKTQEELEKVIGANALNNFKMSVYEELKYRLNNNFLPDFSNRNYWNNGALSLASEPRNYTNFSDLLSPKAIAYLRLNDWSFNDLEKDFSLYVINQIQCLTQILKEQKSSSDLSRVNQQELESTNNNIADIQNLVSNLSTRINDLESFEERMRSYNFNELSEVQEIKRTITNINNLASDLNDKAREINNFSLEFRGNMLNTTGEIETLKQRFENFEQNNNNNNISIDEFEDFKERYFTLSNLFEPFGNKLQELEAKITTLESRPDVSQKISELTAKQNEYSRKFEEIKTSIQNAVDLATTSNESVRLDILNQRGQIISILRETEKLEQQIISLKTDVFNLRYKALLKNDNPEQNVDDERPGPAMEPPHDDIEQDDERPGPAMEPPHDDIEQDDERPGPAMEGS